MRERRDPKFGVRSSENLGPSRLARPASLARRFYAGQYFTDLPVWNNGRMPRRMLKKSVQQGRSERGRLSEVKVERRFGGLHLSLGLSLNLP
jgi:hypothetical protein